jgi:hypothetical protein
MLKRNPDGCEQLHSYHPQSRKVTKHENYGTMTGLYTSLVLLRLSRCLKRGTLRVDGNDGNVWSLFGAEGDTEDIGIHAPDHSPPHFTRPARPMATRMHAHSTREDHGDMRPRNIISDAMYTSSPQDVEKQKTPRCESKRILLSKCWTRA